LDAVKFSPEIAIDRHQIMRGRELQGDTGTLMDFHHVEQNLREMFRSLAEERGGAEVREAAGVTVVSLGAAFQMFNAVFLSAPVMSESEFQTRIAIGAQFMAARGLPWSLWVCEDWLAAPIRKRMAKICSASGLELASDMPGMAIERLKNPERAVPELSFARVTNEEHRRAFCGIGSVCFHVPSGWFDEVFDHRMIDRHAFEAWVAYLHGEPVATAATVTTGGVIGLYNVAVLPGYRKRGYAESVMRHAAGEARKQSGLDRLILQSTRQAIRMYQRLGFSPVTRILVFTS
jgi:ribosomal protein S18 acetylase RimI-like enzyme